MASMAPLRTLLSLVAASSLVAQAPEAPVPSAAIVIENESGAAWTGIVPVSIPWPRGAHASIEGVAIAGEAAPCETMWRWPDGSVALVRAWPKLRLAPGSKTRLAVRPVAPRPESDEGEWWFDGTLPLQTIVTDPWGDEFVAEWKPETGEGFEYLGSRCHVRKFRVQHRGVRGANLWLRGYLTSYRDSRRAELTLVLDNDPERGEVPLGPVRLRRFVLRTTDSKLKFQPRFARQLGLALPVRNEFGGFDQDLLSPSDQHYLGDRTGKAFRFSIFLDGDEVSDAERERAALVRPTALPGCAWTRHTRAFGAHGGPAPAESSPRLYVRQALDAWRDAGGFGPYGDFGDPAFAAAQGTVRNEPMPLRQVVRCESGTLLEIGEGRVLQHTLRPTAGYAPRRPPAMRDYRSGMSERVVLRPHGFTPLDYEHFSVDLLYDYWWLTADPLAFDEIARAGRSLVPLLEGLPFSTSRGEGWCMQAAVLIARATGDREIVDYVHRRFVETVLPETGKRGQPFAIRQPPHALAFGSDGDWFDAPWQMAAFVYGLKALFEETDDVRIADTAVRTARIMATAGWVTGVGPKYIVRATDPTRFTMPVGFGPREGTGRMHTGAFVLARELLDVTESESDRSLLTDRADFLMEGSLLSVEAARDPWFQIYLDRSHR